MSEADLPSVCVITQPARRQTGKTHAHQLLDLIGASTHVSLLTANLSSNASIRDEHDIVEFTDTGTGDSIPITIYRFFRNQFRLARAVAGRDEDAVLFFGSTAYLLPLLVAKAIGKTVVVQPRGDVPRSLRLKWERQVPQPIAKVLAQLVSLLERIGYVLADAIVTYTPSMAASLDVDRYEDKLFSNGARYVDTELFSRETALSERPMAVGYLGRLDVEKDVPMLAEVAKRITPEIEFRFIGDGDFRSQIEERLSAEISEGEVVITGWLGHDEIPRELNRIRLLILTSEPTEGLPTAILEAFACGTPVFATPVAGVPDVVREGQTGYLLTDKDPEITADMIEEALAGETLPAMSDRCRDIAESEFGFEVAVERYRTVLRSIAE